MNWRYRLLFIASNMAQKHVSVADAYRLLIMKCEMKIGLPCILQGELVDTWRTVEICVSIAAGSSAEQRKGAGSAALLLGSCGNMARDVLPWQPSSTDPLMGCLVCQCDSCWTEGYMCSVHLRLDCAWDVGDQTEETRDRVTKIDWQRERRTSVWTAC